MATGLVISHSYYWKPKTKTLDQTGSQDQQLLTKTKDDTISPWVSIGQFLRLPGKMLLNTGWNFWLIWSWV